MMVPEEAILAVHGIFKEANTLVTKMLNENPNIWETSLDTALITSLNRYSEPIEVVRDLFIHIQTHFLGSRRLFGRWEIADIGVLIMYRVNKRLVRTKVLLLQSKRLYPVEVQEPREDELYHYEIGFARLYREHEDYTADLTPRVFNWNWNSEYRAVKKGSDQEKAVREYASKTKVPVYYLLYNPGTLPWHIPVPLHRPIANPVREIGSRVVAESDMVRACAALREGDSPTIQSIRSAREEQHEGMDVTGYSLEDFVANRALRCWEGYATTDLQDEELGRVFFRRTAPISAAISITVDLPPGTALE